MDDQWLTDPYGWTRVALQCGGGSEPPTKIVTIAEKS